MAERLFRPPPFRPVPWLPGGDLQTIVPSLYGAPSIPATDERRWIEVDAGTRVLLEIDRPKPPIRGTLLLIHGMGGSAASGYIADTAALAVEEGWVAVRMNLRTCGGTEGQSRTLYNAGQSEDAAEVFGALDRETPATFPRPFAAVGYSLGGNLLLRYAGHAGDGCHADAVAAVNPPVDLARCLRELERLRNRPYELHYVTKLCRQLELIRSRRHLPGPRPTLGNVRRLRRLDSLYTAPDAGYPSAEAYYAAASAAPTLQAIRRPTLILSATNDPIVPPETLSIHRGSPRITFLQPSRGGHCGYWQRGRPRNWAARALMDFLQASPG
jgi:predicted alpha/beta-fold hydrolase